MARMNMKTKCGIESAVPLVVASMQLIVGALGCHAQPFTESLEFGTGYTIPQAWCDFDGDGDLDLAIGNWGQDNELYVNQGDGTFERVVAFGKGATFAVVWADFDNDGDADLAVANATNAPCYLFVNEGNGQFTETTPFGSDRSIALACGDYDNDGDLDLAVGNGITGVAGQNRLYVNQGDGTYIGEDQFGIEQTDSLAWADFDSDGDLDLAVGNGGFSGPAQNALYVNNGDGSFTQRSEFGRGDTAVLAWADADNDGDLDLAVGNWTATQDYLYRNNGDGSFTELPVFGARDTNTMAWGDCDNDGDLDLAVGNGDFTNAEQNYLYLNNGAGTFVETAEFGIGSTDSVAWADGDHDGDLDLGAGNEHSSTQNYWYTNALDATAYLHLNLVGMAHQLGAGYSNRDAVGAKVSVYAAGHLGDPEYLLGFRELSAHGGFASQNQPGAWFGLAEHEAVDVSVVWPGSAGSQITQHWTALNTSQSIELVEASPLLAQPAPGLAGQKNIFALRGATPGHEMWLVYGLRSGSTNVPWCPGVTVNIRNPKLFGRVSVDGLGNAALVKSVPSGVRGIRLLLQAIDREGCVVSNLLATKFQ